MSIHSNLANVSILCKNIIQLFICDFIWQVPRESSIKRIPYFTYRIRFTSGGSLPYSIRNAQIVGTLERIILQFAIGALRAKEME